MPARAAHGRRDEVAAAEAVAVALDDRERLVPEHERAAVGRDAEEPFRDLAVGSADADLEHAHQQRVVVGPHGGNVRDPRRVGDAGVGDERQHQAAVRPPSITSTRAGDELGRSEVEDRVGDLLGRAEAAERLPRAQRVERLADVLDEAAHPGRVDRARARRR